MTYKVIVADGSPSVRKALELALPESDFELFFFDNGLELAKASAARPGTSSRGRS